MKIRNIFLPHKKNGFHPHILRPLGLGIVLAMVLLQPLLYNVAAKGHFQVLGYATDISSSNLYSLTNQERSQAGIASLSYNSLLAAAAQNKAQDMFAKNYWAHNSPDGLTPWYFIGATGYKYTTAGENLAKDFSTSAGVMSGWMNSPDHRANVLNSAFKDVGFAVVNGTLLGSPTTLVVAMYGAQAAVVPPPATVKASPPAAVTQTAPVASTPAPEPATATETPAPTPNPEPAKTQTPAATVKNQSEVKGDKVQKEPLNISLPVIANAVSLQTLNWGQRVSVFLLSILILINLLKHTLVWRAQKRGARHIWLRAHPIAQTSILLIAIMVTISSSYGVIV